MKQFLFILLFILNFHFSKTQSLSLDLAGNINKENIASFGFGFQFMAPIGETNFHINWQMILGGDTESNLYFRGSAATLLYKKDWYWEYSPDSTSTTPGRERIGAFIIAAIFPIICPTGITYDIPPFSDKFSMGIYANPLLADYWNDRFKVASFTVEGGFKFYFPEKNGGFYLNLGIANVKNQYRYENSGYRNGWMISVTTGIGGNLGE
jgi:hypothetical protein